MAMRDDGTGRAAATLAAVALVAALGGCAGPEASVEQAAPEIVSLEVDVRRALLEADDVPSAAIRVLVDETGSVVTLDGFVESEAERDEALRLARDAVGARATVRDDLEIR